MNVMIDPSVTELGEVVVVSNGVSRVKRSAFNAIAVDTKEFQNSTKNLSDALAKAPGMKLRESGGCRFGYAIDVGWFQWQTCEDIY